MPNTLLCLLVLLRGAIEKRVGLCFNFFAMKKEILKNFRNNLISKDKLKSIKGGVQEGGVCTVITPGSSGFAVTTYWSEGSCCSPGAGAALVNNYDSVGNFSGATYVTSAAAAAAHPDCT